MLLCVLVIGGVELYNVESQVFIFYPFNLMCVDCTTFWVIVKLCNNWQIQHVPYYDISECTCSVLQSHHLKKQQSSVRQTLNDLTVSSCTLLAG